MLLLARLLLLLALLAPAAPAPAQMVAQAVAQHLFFEAVTDDLPAALPYDARQRLTERARDDLLPAALRESGVEVAEAATELRMGGYQRRTNPSLHMAVTLPDDAADRLAAALAWVLNQESVLVADFSSADGTTGYALVRFPDGTLTPDLAQRFFLAAAAVDGGLGGGYTAFGDSMLFLNLRGADGRPFSGLSDADFTAVLGRAVATFPGAVLAETGRADARLIERPSTAPSPTLAPLRARHAALVQQTRTPENAR